MINTMHEDRLITRIRNCRDSGQLESLFNEVCRKIPVLARGPYITEINARDDYLSGVFFKEKEYLEL